LSPYDTHIVQIGSAPGGRVCAGLRKAMLLLVMPTKLLAVLAVAALGTMTSLLQQIEDMRIRMNELAIPLGLGNHRPPVQAAL
jgi:hypothetical protein